ncbi:MAG: hypothetical protein H0V33_12555 [Acidimicrobiia bacterium]|nr:hypothetical protein [Acidimicrobiia bacterium]
MLAVEALGANPEASEQFAAMGEDQVGSLIFGADGVGYTGDEDYVRFVEAASNALEHAIITEGELGTGGEPTRTDEILIDIIQVGGTVDEDGKTEVNDVVPDRMRNQLAALSVLSMGRIEDFVVASPLEADVQAYFAELSLNADAVGTLTEGVMIQLAVNVAEAVETYTHFDEDVTKPESDLEEALVNGVLDTSDLMRTLGAAFNEASVDAQARDDAIIGVLNWIGDGAAGVGLATTPLTGGTGALVGLGVNGVIDLGVAIFDDANEPPPDESIEYVETIDSATEEVLARVIYENPEMRARLVDENFADNASQPDATTMSFEEFAALEKVQFEVRPPSSDVGQSVIVDIIYNAFQE